MKTFYILFCALLIGMASYGQTITPKGPTTFCTGDSVVLTAPSGGTNYQWYNNSNAIPLIQGATNDTFVAKVSGKYTVAYTNTKRDSTVAVNVTVTVNSLPTPSITFSPNSPVVCANSLFTFIANGGAATYAWSFQNSSTPTPSGNPVKVRFDNATGNGNADLLVTLTETSAAQCSASIQQKVTVHQIPDCSVTSPNTQVTQFNGQQVFSSCGGATTFSFQFLNMSSTFASNTKYFVNWGDGNNDTLTYTNSTWAYNSTIQHSYSTGNYTFTLTTTNTDGCTNTKQYGVFIGTNPGGGLTTFGNTTICVGDSIPFGLGGTSKNPNGTLYSFVWTDGPGTIYSTQNFTQPPPDTVTQVFSKSSCGISDKNGIPNSFSVVMTITNPCSVLSGRPTILPVGTISVSQKPAPAFIISPHDTVCVNSTINIINTGPTINSSDGNSTCLVGLWKISPSTGWSVVSGTLGNDKGSSDQSLWTFGDNQVGVNFTVPGTYTVTLEEGGGNCGDSSLTKTICVNPAPTASFTLGTTTGCAPLKSVVTTTTNTPTCGQYTYQWTVAYTPTAGCVPNKGSITYLSGTSDTSRQPVFQFNDPGVYTVSLLVYGPDSACTAVATTTTPTVTVMGKPNIASLGIPSAICQGQSINPAPLDSCYVNNSTSYSWSFVGGTPATSAVLNPGLVTYTLSGTYNVTLAVDNKNGCGPSSVTKPITVNPVPDLSARFDTSYCVGAVSGAYNFTSKLAGTTITWSNSNTAIGLGASGTGNINSFTTKNTGTTPIKATITVTATNTNCSTQASFTITVNPVPGLPSVTNPVNLCTGTAAQPLTATADAGNTLVWYAAASGGVGSPTAFTPTTNRTGTQLYYVSQANHLNALACESGRAVIQVIVDTTPTITFGSAQGPGNCSSQTGSITLKGLIPNKTYTVCYSFNGNPQTCVPNIPSDAAGNLVLGNLGSGTYTNISVTLGQCPSNTIVGPIQISDPIKPAAPSVVFNASPVCSKKAVQLLPSPISQGSTYTWYGPGITAALKNQTTPSFTATTNLAGNYTVSVTDANGCTSDQSVQATLQVDSTPVKPIITGTSPVCTGTPFTLTGSKYSYPVTYTWAPVPNPSIIKDSTLTVPSATTGNSATYTLVVTNVVSSPTANSCPSGPATIQVIVNPTPNISKADSTNPQSCGASDGQITLYGLAGTTNYTVFYTDASGTVHSKTIKSDNLGNVVITGLSATASPYTNIYVQDAVTLCTSNAVNRGIKLSDPNPPATPTVSSNKPVCTGKTVQLQASPTLPGVTYTWSGPGITPAIANTQNPSFTAIKALDGTSYTVTVTQNGCTSSPSLPETIQVDSTPVKPIITGTNPICTGTPFTLTGSKYSYPVTYTWTPVPNPSIIKDSTLTVPSATTGNSATYTLVVTNVVSSPTANSCPSGPATIQVIVNPTPNISKADSADPKNCGASDGQITLYGLAGSTNYTVFYTDASGTVHSKTIKSDNLGNVVITGLSATASPYTNIYVQDTVTLCTSNAINRGIKLTDPNPPATPTASSNKPVCTGKTVQLQASPTLPGVTYTWSGPGITPAIANTQNPSFAAIKALDGTSYTVTVTQNGCTSSPSLPETIQVDSTPVKPIITGTSPVCTGSAFTLTGSKYSYPVTYTWAPVPNPSIIKDSTLTVPSATTGNSATYTLVVTNVVSSPTANSCPSGPATIQVIVNPTPNIVGALPTDPKSCGAADGFITLQGLAPNTTYIVDYIDGLGESHTVTIKSDTNGNVVITGLAASGSPYTKICVQDATSLCTSNTVGPVTLTDPSPPAAPTASSNGPVCDGNVLNLFASPNVPGGVYAWSGPCINNANANLQNPSFTATVACTGTYFVTVTTNYCTSLPGQVSVVVNANAAVPTANANTPVCSGSLLNLTANSTPVGTGPITYFWTGPCITASNSGIQNPSFPAALSCAGTYCVTAFNAGCTSPAPGCVNVAVNPTPAVTSDYKNPTSCGTNTGSITLYGLLSGVAYSLEYDYNGVPQPKQYPSFTNPSGDIVIDNLPAGIYANIRVTTPAGCTSNIIGPDTLVNLAAPVPTANSNGPLCVGSTLHLTSFVAPLLGTVTYTWAGPGAVHLQPSNNVQNPAIPVTTMADSGLYTVTATVNGCSLSASVNVVINSKSVGGHTFNDTTVCYGTNTGTIYLGGNNGKVANWEYSTDNGITWLAISNTATSLVFTNLTTTTWYRAVVQNGACDAVHSDSTVITVINSVPKAYAGPDQILCNQQSVNLAATKALIGTGVWTQTAGSGTNITPTNAPNATVTPLVPATYDFLWTVTGPAGCGSSSAQVQIINRPAITQAHAGPEQDMCNFTKTTTVSLAGNLDATRPFEHGLWTIASQPVNGSGTFGDATSPTSTFTFSQPGIYKLAWTISNDVGAACGISTDTLVINIANPPVAAFNVNPTGLCVGQAVTVTNTSVNTNVYNWHWGDGLASTFVSGTHTYPSAAPYTITLIAENILPAAHCIDSATQTVTVADVIPAVINITPGNPCIPYNLQADAVGASGASLIEWRVFDNAVSPYLFYATGYSTSHQFDFAGVDSIRLVVHNQGICTDSASYKFTVYSVPVTTFAPPSFSTCNHDTTVVFQATTTYTGSDPVNYKWFVNDQLSGNTNPFNYTFNTPASSTSPVEYTIKLLAQNTGNCGDSSTAQKIIVMPLPPAGIRVAPSIIQQEPDYTFTFTDTTAADQFKIDKWYLGDRSNQTRSGTEVQYQYSDSGSYFIKLLATDFSTGCTNTDTVTVRILYVPGYLQVADAFCPGCSKDELRTFLPLGKGLSYYRLRIYTIWGKLLFETTQLNADGSPAEAWKGDDHGQPVQQDAYRWEIEARFINGTEWKGMLYPNNSQRVKSGFITIIK